MKRTKADETHLKNPKVIRLIGNSKILITGFAKSEVTVTPIPAIARVKNPLEKTIPEAICDTAQREKVSIVKWRSIRFITLSIQVTSDG